MINIEEYILTAQKELDQSYDDQLEYWLSKGLDLHQAELAVLINGLPLGGVPTKYKELRRKCRVIAAQDD